MSLKSELAKISKPYVRKSEILTGEKGNKVEVRCYDNLGRSIDRYCVYFMDEKNERNRHTAYLAMDATPFYAQGFGQHGEGVPGPHNGKRIRFSELPTDCQKCVMNDVNFEA